MYTRVGDRKKLFELQDRITRDHSAPTNQQSAIEALTMTNGSRMTLLTTLLCLVIALLSIIPNVEAFGISPVLLSKIKGRHATLIKVFEDEQPSDYDSSELMPTEQDATVDLDDNDIPIRDALKRELLLLASVTNRGSMPHPKKSTLSLTL